MCLLRFAGVAKNENTQSKKKKVTVNGHYMENSEKELGAKPPIFILDPYTFVTKTTNYKHFVNQNKSCLSN